MATRMTMKNLVLRPGSPIWQFRKKQGDKTYRMSTGETDPKRAQRKAIEFLKDINDGKQGWTKKTKAMPTYDVYAQKYLDVYSSQKVNPVSDHTALARSIEFWQDRPLDSIIRSDCGEYLNWRLGAARPDEAERRKDDGDAGAINTVLHECTMIGAVFNTAIADQFLTRNPWKGLRKPTATIRMRTLSLDEQGLLMTALTPEDCRLVTCYIGTGLRADEMHKLEASDIDFENAVINLPKHKVKGKKRGRIVPLWPEVVVALQEQIRVRTEHFDSRGKLKGSHGAARVNRTALFNMSRKTALQVLQHAAVRAGTPDTFTLHDLRRTFGSRCAEQGLPIKHLSVIMGHSDIRVTARYYVHIGDDNLKSVMMKISIGLSVAVPTEKVVNFEKRA